MSVASFDWTDLDDGVLGHLAVLLGPAAVGSARLACRGWAVGLLASCRTLTASGAPPAGMVPRVRHVQSLTWRRLPGRAVPAELHHFACLTALDLSGCDVGGPDGVAGLERLAKLTALNLSGNPLCAEDLGRLQALTGLVELDVGRTRVMDDQALRGLQLPTSLTRLSLSCGKLTDRGIQPLQLLTRLTHLDLGHTWITDQGLISLQPLTCLTYLDLGGCMLSAVRGWNDETRLGPAAVEMLAILTNLSHLNLISCRIGGLGVQNLRQLPLLTSLSLRSSHLTDDQLGLLSATALTCLDLSGNCVGATSARMLQGMPSLRSLDLGQCHIDDSEVMGLQCLPGLTWLSLRDNPKLGDDAVESLQDLTGLTFLDLGLLGCTARALWALQNLTCLRELRMEGCDCSGYGTGALWVFSSLTSLQLVNCSLDNTAVGNLRRLCNLQNLSLCGNSAGYGPGSHTLSSSGLTALRHLSSLCSLDLTACRRVSDEGAEALGALTSLTHLDISATSVSSAGLEKMRPLVMLSSLYISSRLPQTIWPFSYPRRFPKHITSIARLQLIFPALRDVWSR